MINETYVEFIEQQFNIEQNRPFKAITSIAVEKLISKKECVCVSAIESVFNSKEI